MNKQNCCFWGTEKPNFHYEKPLHGDKITVWVTLSSAGVIGPFFFEEKGDNATVNSERYIQLLKNKFMSALRRIGINTENMWFQQDGATTDTAKHVLSWLHETFGENFISFKTENIWPPYSPDLNPLDLFLWGYLKDKVYTPKPATLQDLKNAIRREIEKITPEMCESVIDNFKKRLDVIIAQKGRHIEYMM